MTPRIRKMKLSDHADVSRVWQRSEGLTLRDSDSETSIEQYLEKNPELSFVAESGGQVVGVVLAGTDGRRGYLQHLAVLDTHRGAGIGTALVKAAVEGLRKAGIEKTHLFVHVTNIDAQRFYERLGWVPRDEVRMFSFNSGPNENI